MRPVLYVGDRRTEELKKFFRRYASRVDRKSARCSFVELVKDGFTRARAVVLLSFGSSTIVCVCVVKSVLGGRTCAKGDFYLSSIAPAELVELSMTCRRLAALLSF